MTISPWLLALAPALTAQAVEPDRVDDPPALLATDAERSAPEALPALASRARAVAFSRDALATLHADLDPAGRRLELATFDGATVELSIETALDGVGSTRILLGRVDDDPDSSFSLATDGRTAAGFVRPHGGLPLALRGSDAGPLLLELDPATRAARAVPRPERELQLRELIALAPPATPTAAPDAPTAEAGTPSIDVLLLVTPNVLAAAGGPIALQLELEAALAEGTGALADSGVGAQFALAGLLPVDYDEAGATHDQHLLRLSDPSDGVLDAIHDWRAAAGADLVSLIVDDSDGGTTAGTGYILPPAPLPFYPGTGPFNTVDYGALGNLELPHQLGHNMGCAHEFENASIGLPDVGLPQLPYPALPNAFGWRWTGNSSTDYRSIMAIGTGQRVARFSNPQVDFDGVPTGKLPAGLLDPGADNAGALNALLPTITGFVTPPAPLTDVYVDLDVVAVTEDGSPGAPYDSLEEGLLRVASGGRLIVRGTTTGTPPMVEPVLLERWTAPALLLD